MKIELQVHLTCVKTFFFVIISITWKIIKPTRVHIYSFSCEDYYLYYFFPQFLHAIHALRLLPGIGFFVITTKKMAKHLVQFALVFVIVSLAFATIFHFVMRDKDCPALKVTGFTGLAESLFSTYQVALGQGDHKFTYNFNS